MMSNFGQRSRAAVALSATVALAAGCGAVSSGSSKDPNTSTAKHSGPIKIMFLQKQGSQDYFVDEMNGAKQAAAAQGKVTITPVDVNMDNNATVNAVKSANAQGVNGIIIVPPDGSTGPEDWRTAKSSNIPMISADDEVCTNNPNPDSCKSGDLLPRVGFDAQQMGTEVGQEAGKLFKQKSGWTAANTRVLELWQFSTSVCTPRVTYAAKLLRQTGGPTAGSIPAIKIDTDNSQSGDPQSAQSKTQSTVNAYHNIDHWIVLGCNDQNVAGAVTALSDSGVKPANILSVGLGGDVACKGWKANAANAMDAALLLNGSKVGSNAVNAMVDHIRNGAKFPQLVTVPVTMANKSTWKATGFICH